MDHSITIKPDSQTTVLLDTESSRDCFVIHIKEHAQAMVVFFLDNRTESFELSMEMEGERSTCSIIGLVLAKQGKIQVKTLQHHIAPHTMSNLCVKSVDCESTSFDYYGSIRVEKTAQRTDAYQRNENLVLTNDCHIDSQPALEILANDVRCTHGATITRIDPDQLYYLHTRGIEKPQAEALIMEGFASSLLSGIEGEHIKQKFSNIWQQFLKERSDL